LAAHRQTFRKEMFMGWVRAHPITAFLVWFFTVG
jgi:hypothetical protein